jgi:acyl carrier protein
MMKVLSHFDKVNLKTFNWEDELGNSLKLDSLEQTALLVAVEHEFHIVFEDRVFENFTNLEQVIRFIATDNYAF